MKIKSIKRVGKKPVYDISVVDAEHYVLENGVITHNTGMYLSSDNIWIVGRAQEKEDGELAGYKFTINIEKSRHVKEKSKIPIVVSFEGGINKWSGLFDLGLELGIITEAKKGWYNIPGSDKAKRRADIEFDDDFWNKLTKSTEFKTLISKKYKLANMKMLIDDENNSV